MNFFLKSLGTFLYCSLLSLLKEIKSLCLENATIGSFDEVMKSNVDLLYVEIFLFCSVLFPITV